MSQKRYLGDLVDFVNGDRSANYPSAADYIEGGIPFVSAAEIDSGRIDLTKCKRISRGAFDRLRSGKVTKGDTLYCLRGTLGKIGRVSDFDEGAIASSLAIVRAKPDVSADFIYYFLASPEGQTAAIALNNGSAQPNISVKALSRLVLDCPPLPEQRAIAATLVALDDKIELNRKMNATLESMARALFRDWFVDFGPTRAKMEARAPYLSPDLWSLFPDRLDDEGTPEGWKAGILGDVATAKNEGVDPSSIHSDTPYIGLEHMPRGSIALNDWEGAGKVSSNKAAFAAGDFLFGKLRPYFHKVGIAPVSGICSTDIVVVRPKSLAWAGFVIACISDDDFVAYTDKTSTGTKMPRTSWTIMAKYPIMLPSSQLAEAFNVTVGSMLENIRANIKESRTLAQTRDLLLPRLMSGDLRVLEATLKQEVLA